MKVEEILDNLAKYPKESVWDVLQGVRENKEELTPKFLDIVKNYKKLVEDFMSEEMTIIDLNDPNFEKLVEEENEKNPRFALINACIFLSVFGETKAFPYLIEAFENYDYMDFVLNGNGYNVFPRLLASTYNGDDKKMFKIIENVDIDDFYRQNVLSVFGILYLYGVKDRDFLIKYFRKLISESVKRKELEFSAIYKEIVKETIDLKLKEFAKEAEELLPQIQFEEEREDYRKKLQQLQTDDKPVELYSSSVYPTYRKIYNALEVLEDSPWFHDAIMNEIFDFYLENGHGLFWKSKIREIMEKIDRKSRNEGCYCRSGKKLKKCCINKNSEFFLSVLTSYFDKFSELVMFIDKKQIEMVRIRGSQVLRFFKMLCDYLGITSISNFSERFDSSVTVFDFLLPYAEMLYNSDKPSDWNSLIELKEELESVFTFETEKEQLLLKQLTAWTEELKPRYAKVVEDTINVWKD